MAFAGKYELITQENVEAFGKIVGLTDDIIEKVKVAKTVMEITQNGNEFSLKSAINPQNPVLNTFTLGQECTFKSPLGREMKGVVTMEGNKLKGKFDKHEQTIEFDAEGNLRDTIYREGVTYVRISKRI